MKVSGQFHAPVALFQGKSPWYPLDRRLGGSHSRSGHGGEEKNSSPCRESNPRTPIVQPVAQCYSLPAIPSLKRCKTFHLANSKARRHNCSDFRTNKLFSMNKQCSTTSFSCFWVKTFLNLHNFLLDTIVTLPSFLNCR